MSRLHACIVRATLALDKLGINLLLNYPESHLAINWLDSGVRFGSPNPSQKRNTDALPGQSVARPSGPAATSPGGPRVSRSRSSIDQGADDSSAEEARDPRNDHWCRGVCGAAHCRQPAVGILQPPYRERQRRLKTSRGPQYFHDTRRVQPTALRLRPLGDRL